MSEIGDDGPCMRVCKCLPTLAVDVDEDVGEGEDELEERRSPLYETLERDDEIAKVNSEYHYSDDSCLAREHLTCDGVVSRNPERTFESGG